MRVEEVDTEGGDTVVIESCTVEGCTDFGTSERKMLQRLEEVSPNPNHRPKPLPNVLDCYAVYNGH